MQQYRYNRLHYLSILSALPLLCDFVVTPTKSRMYICASLRLCLAKRPPWPMECGQSTVNKVWAWATKDIVSLHLFLLKVWHCSRREFLSSLLVQEEWATWNRPDLSPQPESKPNQAQTTCSPIGSKQALVAVTGHWHFEVICSTAELTQMAIGTQKY